ncbi:DUF2894 domain-containing protein [Marinobacter sp. DY40_1A1]|uniref:DUF2894 domain-containing protein n=1 Tax=Marinobacter sp. DY40_1A1 TaxID=2583229 RepID=UPI0019034D8F|nr:DUF2894 domain-containing protein [Marinobacter sp. DY40_1A1]MBK1885084.1 DUF2894 domain-containing protein [Marinobacter sp. DY40_1A1]
MNAIAEAKAMHPQLEDLRNSGADQMNPVGFRYLEALALRLEAKGLQHTPHWQKLEQAVADYKTRFEVPQQSTQAIETLAPSPLSALLDKLNQTQSAPQTQPRSTLEQLVFGAPEEGSEAPQRAAAANPRQPLKAMTRASADRGEQALQDRVRHAIEQAPEDAGPMNAHRLVSLAMAEMQRLSPDYLNRLVKYTDTLMALEKLGRKGMSS